MRAVKWLKAPRRAWPFTFKGRREGPLTTLRHVAAAYVEGLGRMSRMTLLQGEIWLGSGPESGLPRFVRAPEAGYPPFNVELLPEGDGTRSTLRITLAVAGFGVDELAVTVEGGQ